MSPEQPVTIVVGSKSRLAFEFTLDGIRLYIPRRVPGSYLLLNDGRPVYIGRSDTCLRTRLRGHPLLGQATHVTWEPVSSPHRAFLIEAFWFHELSGHERTLNLIHPARPDGSQQPCPYCHAGHAETIALARALSANSSRRGTVPQAT